MTRAAEVFHAPEDFARRYRDLLEWDIAVFENLCPTLTLAARDAPELPVSTAPGKGVCEVIVFTQDAGSSLGRLPLDHLELVALPPDLEELPEEKVKELQAVAVDLDA